MKNRNLPLALCSVLVLSACGGGGGGSGGSGAAAPAVSTASVITSANANKVAGNAYAGTTAISESSPSFSSMLTRVSVGGGNIGVVRPALNLIRNVYPRPAGQLLTGVVMTEACSGGGSVTIDARVRNEQMASNGDTIIVTAQRCVEDGMTINGTLSATLSNVSGDVFNTYTWGATLDTTFTNFGVTSGNETASVNGDMKIAITQTNYSNHSMSLSGKSLQASMQRGGVTLESFAMTNYSMTGSTNGATVSSAASFTMAGSSSALGQYSYTVKNLQPFVSNGSAMPHAGSMLVTGNASSVTLSVASNSTVRVELSAKGDGAITQTNNLSWTELLAAI